jgi:hypothetical protein
VPADPKLLPGAGLLLRRATPGPLVFHLGEQHSVKVHSLQYHKDKAFQLQTVPMPDSPLARRKFVKGEDDALFVLTMEAFGPAIAVVTQHTTACVVCKSLT